MTDVQGPHPKPETETEVIPPVRSGDGIARTRELPVVEDEATVVTPPPPLSPQPASPPEATPQPASPPPAATAPAPTSPAPTSPAPTSPPSAGRARPVVPSSSP